MIWIIFILVTPGHPESEETTMPGNSIVRKLQSFDHFQKLSELDLANIASQAQLIHLNHGRPLFTEGTAIDAVYLILYGSFKIQQKARNSEAVVFSFLSRGDFLGIAMAGLRKAVYPASAIANEESAVLKFSLNFFNEHFLHHPALREVISQQIADRFYEFQNDRCMTKALTPQKLANLLLRTLDRQPKEHGHRIGIPMTRHDMARKIGSQSETVIRFISEWTKNGWIRTENKHIEILDRSKLEEILNEKSSRRSSRTPSVYSKAT